MGVVVNAFIIHTIEQEEKQRDRIRQHILLKYCSAQTVSIIFNPTALRMAKTLWSFGHSE